MWRGQGQHVPCGVCGSLACGSSAPPVCGTERVFRSVPGCLVTRGSLAAAQSFPGPHQPPALPRKLLDEASVATGLSEHLPLVEGCALPPLSPSVFPATRGLHPGCSGVVFAWCLGDEQYHPPGRPPRPPLSPGDCHHPTLVFTRAPAPAPRTMGSVDSPRVLRLVFSLCVSTHVPAARFLRY